MLELSFIDIQIWIHGVDTVRSSEHIEHSELLSEVQPLNQRGHGPNAGELKHWVITTTTNSIMNILAKDIEVQVKVGVNVYSIIGRCKDGPLNPGNLPLIRI